VVTPKGRVTPIVSSCFSFRRTRSKPIR
jgi:hypothetical protein